MLKQSTLSKLTILADAAKYDVSCASSGVNRKSKGQGIGNSKVCGICHAWSTDGRCISLLKILLTNDCIYDCSYCINRYSNDVARASFSPEEVADLTVQFYRRNYIEGLFLSSAIEKNPNFTMEKIYRTLKILREDYQFNGYIHIKAIPGADPLLIKKTGELTDRMSVNIELPSEQSLKLLAPQKSIEKLFLPMSQIKQGIIESKDTRKHFRSANKFVPGGQSTQMIVGASQDSDLSILYTSEQLYQKFKMKRVYYSAYIPVNDGPLLPSLNTAPPLLREHRLYQADWLLRFYKFKASEILNESNPNLNLDFDPKMNWALLNIHLFPLEINKVSYEELLRIPGIGQISALRILRERRLSPLSIHNLKKLGVVVKRAKYFITCQGRYYGGIKINPQCIKNNLLPKKQYQQISMFDN